MAKVTKSFQQFKKGIDHVLESSLSITVDFDVHANEVEKIISVEVYNYDTKATTCITAIFAEQMTEQLDQIIEQTDWREEYMLQRQPVFDYDTAD